MATQSDESQAESDAVENRRVIVTIGESYE